MFTSDMGVEKGETARGPFCQEQLHVLFGGGNAAPAGTDQHAGPSADCGVTERTAGILDGHQGGGKGILDERIGLVRFLWLS